MNDELMAELERRAAVHAALADPARLAITDALADGDASPSELAGMLAMPSNLLAHHLKVLEESGLVARHRSEGDRRRTYLRLVPGVLDSLAGPPGRAARRGVFVCTANSARSHLAAALWRRASPVPAVSAGTRPAERIHPGAVDAAGRRRLPLPRLRPRHISDVLHDGVLVVTVCDLAHEELGAQAAVHWSVPDPVPAGDPGSFDAALTELDRRVTRLPPPGVPPDLAARGRPARPPRQLAPVTVLRRSSSTVSRHRPWWQAMRSRVPTMRDPAFWCSRTLTAFSGNTLLWMVQIPAASEE